MKKYRVESYCKHNEKNGSKIFETVYECERFELTKNWTGECIRMDDVNSLKEGKKGPVRKQFSRGKYETVEKMRHWAEFYVRVYENATGELIREWKA